MQWRGQSCKEALPTCNDQGATNRRSHLSRGSGRGPSPPHCLAPVA